MQKMQQSLQRGGAVVCGGGCGFSLAPRSALSPTEPTPSAREHSATAPHGGDSLTVGVFFAQVDIFFLQYKQII